MRAIAVYCAVGCGALTGAVSAVGGCTGWSQVTSGLLRNIRPEVTDRQLVPSALSFTGCELKKHPVAIKEASVRLMR